MDSLKIVVTGGPSTGKTSIIEEIGTRGFRCFHEISRSITLEARAQGIPQLFVSDPLLFSEKILKGRLEQFNEASRTSDPVVFFDRGLPDVLAYMDHVGQNYGDSFLEACTRNRYDAVFLLPPWKEIHISDNERHEDFEEALRLHGFLEETYARFGYEVRHVPTGPVDERVDFILNNLTPLP